MLKCEQGHEWETDFDHLRSGTWCRKCSNVKYNIDILQAHAISRGGRCLSTKYAGYNEKITWECAVGHVWESSTRMVIALDSWCPNYMCRSNHGIEELRDVAKARHGRLADTVFIGVDEKYTWECEFHHQWDAIGSSIKNTGQWCRVCKNEGQKHNIEMARELAYAAGGECLSDIYIGSSEKLKWKCVCGNIWESSYASIKRGSWCPICRRNVHSIMEAADLAAENGGFCLTTRYKNMTTKMSWECHLGHRWEATFGSIKRGTWCPYCSTKSRSQKEIFEVLRELFSGDIVYNYRGFDWLRSDKTGARLEIDIYIKSASVAIEYDGKQHFKPVNFGGCSDSSAADNLDKTKYNDRLKDRLIGDSDDVKYFVRFNYKEKITKDLVIKKLRRHGVNI